MVSNRGRAILNHVRFILPYLPFVHCCSMKAIMILASRTRLNIVRVVTCGMSDSHMLLLDVLEPVVTLNDVYAKYENKTNDLFPVRCVGGFTWSSFHLPSFVSANFLSR